MVIALTVGSAGPHLLNELPLFGGVAGLPPWRPVLLTATASALLASVIAARFVESVQPLLPADTRVVRFSGPVSSVELANVMRTAINLSEFGL